MRSPAAAARLGLPMRRGRCAPDWMMHRLAFPRRSWWRPRQTAMSVSRCQPTSARRWQKYLRRARPQGLVEPVILRPPAALPLTTGPITPGVVKVLVRPRLSGAAQRDPRPPLACAIARPPRTLRSGAPLPGVARLLRHRTMAVTASYARVEPGALQAPSRPWPGGGAWASFALPCGTYLQCCAQAPWLQPEADLGWLLSEPCQLSRGAR